MNIYNDNHIDELIARKVQLCEIGKEFKIKIKTLKEKIKESHNIENKLMLLELEKSIAINYHEIVSISKKIELLKVSDIKTNKEKYKKECEVKIIFNEQKIKDKRDTLQKLLDIRKHIKRMFKIKTEENMLEIQKLNKVIDEITTNNNLLLLDIEENEKSLHSNYCKCSECKK